MRNRYFLFVENSAFPGTIFRIMPTTSGTASRLSRGKAVAAVAFSGLLLGSAALAPVTQADASAPSEFDLTAGSQVQAFVVAEGPEKMLDLRIPSVKDVESAAQPNGALYTLEQFLFSGVVNWGGYRFTYYSQQVLPGEGLEVPGRHVNAGGYVADADGYIVLAGDAAKGTVVDTPFGFKGKIYDRGTFGNHLDVYIR